MSTSPIALAAEFSTLAEQQSHQYEEVFTPARREALFRIFSTVRHQRRNLIARRHHVRQYLNHCHRELVVRTISCGLLVLAASFYLLYVIYVSKKGFKCAQIIISVYLCAFSAVLTRYRQFRTARMELERIDALLEGVDGEVVREITRALDLVYSEFRGG